MKEPVAEPVIITAALNGNRDRAEHPATPVTAADIAAEAARCREAGASIIHIHARAPDGGWTADLEPWRETMRQLRAAVPDVLISITSVRPEGVPVAAILDLLTGLAADAATKPDLMSINLGHIVTWEQASGAGSGRLTRHFPNSYDDIARLLAHCAALGIQPELGLMDLGFVSNAVALGNDGLLPPHPWFLVELDSPGYGLGGQFTPSTAANYRALAQPLRQHFPAAIWSAHGNGVAGYAVIEQALADGAHIRVGFEDAIALPDGSRPASNAGIVAWAVARAKAHGRVPIRGVAARSLVVNGGAGGESG